MESVYDKVRAFKKKYRTTLTHCRLKAHSKVIENHLNPDENVKYVFAAQKNNRSIDIFETCVVVITNKRILIGQKRVLWGYFLYSVTPDLYNDIHVTSNLFWGSVAIDTVKELIVLSNISKKALPEIETSITSFMMEAKKDYKNSEDSKC